MRIAIVTTCSPFIRGGGSMLVEGLQAQLLAHGFDVDVAQIPSWYHWQHLPQQSLAMRCFDFTEAGGKPIDRIITMRYPAQAAIHPNKVAWFICHFRGAYDLYSTQFQAVPGSPEGDAMREMLYAYDTAHLREHQKIYTISKTIAARLQTYNGIDADEVVYAPHPNADRFHNAGYGDYFLYTARLSPVKRQQLLIEAMRLVKSDFKLILAGTGDSAVETQHVDALIEQYGLQDRVIATGWIDEEEKIRLTANAYACFYVAFEEDSYGYSTLEAFYSRKAVITCTDSGGTGEVIRDRLNGMIVEPTAEAVAAAMEEMWANRESAAEMGENAHHSLSLHNIGWEHVVQRLTS